MKKIKGKKKNAGIVLKEEKKSTTEKKNVKNYVLWELIF